MLRQSSSPRAESNRPRSLAPVCCSLFHSHCSMQPGCGSFPSFAGKCLFLFPTRLQYHASVLPTEGAAMTPTKAKMFSSVRCAALSMLLALLAVGAAAQTPAPVLLVLEKSDNSVAIVDPATLKIVGRVPAGPDPHEIVVSSNGQLAYISNYGGLGSELNTISVVDVAAQKKLAPISLGALHSAHGLWYSGNKLYFTAETNKVVGRYDPA